MPRFLFLEFSLGSVGKEFGLLEKLRWVEDGKSRCRLFNDWLILLYRPMPSRRFRGVDDAFSVESDVCLDFWVIKPVYKRLFVATLTERVNQILKSQGVLCV